MKNNLKIYNFNACEVNERNGTYGGMAGEKEGITFEDNYWIVKYPKSTRGMRGDVVSYMTSPLSEFIGSHVYDILGYDVHETRLGIRNGKLVVACRDFCKKEGSLREIRTLKNIYNEELSKKIEQSVSSTSSSHIVDIQEVLLHLKYNPVLSKVTGINERFWDSVVVDILINNNDRNNGNWGLLYEDGEYKLAPVFDNGAAFSNKYRDEKINDIISDKERMMNSSVNTSTIYGLNDKGLMSKQVLKIKDNYLKRELQKNIPLIKSKMPDIRQFILDIPEEFEGIPVCSSIRKEFYIKGMELRIEHLLEPALVLHNRKDMLIEPEL